MRANELQVQLEGLLLGACLLTPLFVGQCVALDLRRPSFH
jgi:hypothetical protein